MLKERKEEVINELEQQLNSATSMIVTDYRGLGVQQIAAVRDALRPLGASLLVSKNTLTRIAAQRAGVEGLLEFLSGPTAIAFCDGDAAPVAKALAKAAAETDILKIKGGLIDGLVLDQNAITVLASLPPREQLHAQLVYALAGPITGLASTLAAIPRALAIVLDQVEKQKAAA